MPILEKVIILQTLNAYSMGTITPQSFAQPTKTCFVIMPFSKTNKTRNASYWTNHYENFLKPLVSSSGLEVSRSTPLRQNILREIIHKLTFSDIVIADLTDGNVNVYWELGVRQSFRHCTITIIDEKSKKISFEGSKKIPFDLAGKSMLTYSSVDINKYSFKELFKKAIDDCLKNPQLPDSEVLEAITGRTSIYQVIHQDEIRKRIEGLSLENHANYVTLKAISKIVDENRNRKGLIKKTPKSIGLIHMNDSAANLLLAERYLEEDEKFYTLVSRIIGLISAVNQNIATWHTASDSVESYFTENFPLINQLLDKYQAKLNDIRERAQRWC